MALPTGFIERITAKLGTTVVTNELTQWASQGGASEHTYTVPATETGPAMNVESLNGVDVPKWTDNRLTATFDSAIGGATNSTAIVWFHALLKVPHGQSAAYIWDDSNGFNDLALYANGTSITARRGADTVSATIPDDEWFKVDVRFAGSGVGGFDGAEIYIDGVLATGSNTVTMDPLEGGYLGARQDDFSPGEYAMAERVIYSGDHTAQDLTDIRAHFDSEWFPTVSLVQPVTITINSSS